MKPETAIVREHEDIEALARDVERCVQRGESVGEDEFRKAGEYLLRIKATVGHGSFSAWIKDNLTISERSAQRYMAMVKSATVAEMDDSDPPDFAPEPPAPKKAPQAKTTPKAPQKAPEAHHVPVKGIPKRIVPAFECVEPIRSVVARLDQLIGPLERVEASPAWKAAHLGGRSTSYTSLVKACRDKLKAIEPLRPCKRGCAESEPSVDADECPECHGKGYVTQEDETDA